MFVVCEANKCGMIDWTVDSIEELILELKSSYNFQGDIGLIATWATDAIRFSKGLIFNVKTMSLPL